MKKTMLTLIVLILAITAYSELVPRQKVLVEIGTATWCSPCQGAAMGAEDLIANGHDVAIIKYHSSNCPFTNQHSNSRLSYYGITSIPTAKFDGILTHLGGSSTHSIYPTYLNLYNQRINVPSPFTVAIYFENTGGLNYEANVLVTEVCDNYSASDLVLHFAVTETDIPHVWYNQTHVKDVLRTMVPGPSGTPLDFSTIKEYSVDLSFTFEANWVEENIRLVTFVQDVPSREIFQAEITALFPTVSFDIKDEYGNNINDAIVTFDGKENLPGNYNFMSILPGEYEYKVEKEGYFTVEGDITVGEENVLVEIVMEVISTYTVTFDIKDEEGNDIENAVVTFDGIENPSGDYVFEEVLEGDYEYKVEKDGFYTFEGEVAVDQDITVEVVMETLKVVTFEIIDEGGNEITDAIITFDGITYEPGEYVFENLEKGTYEYKVEKESFYTVEDEVVVEEDITVEVVMEAIPTFTVTFEVLCELYGTSLQDALVTFDNEDYTTDVNGIALIEDVYPGEYYYSVAKQDYITVYGQITVDYKDTEVLVVLALGEDPEYDVVFNVTDEDGDAIEGAVVLFDEQEYTTGAGGQVILEDVIIGTYEYSVSKLGYLTEEGIAEVWYKDLIIDITLALEHFILTLVADPEEGGTLAGGGEYVMDEEVTVTATAAEGWKFAGWTDEEGGQVSDEPEFVYTMPPHNVTLKANFDEISKYKLTLLADPPEAGDVEGEGEYEEGEEVVIKVIPSPDFSFMHWVGDTEYLDDPLSTTPTVTMPAKDITLIAEFSICNIVKENPEINVKIFPNPARDVFTVESSEMIKQIRLISISGQVVMDVDVGTFNTKLNISNLHTGVYFMQINSANSVISERVQIAR